MKKRVLFLSVVIVLSLSASWIEPSNEANLGEEVDIPQEQIITKPVQTNQTTQNSQDSSIWGEEIGSVKEPVREVSIDDFKRLGSLRIALLVPKRVIGSYSKKVSNSILSYLVHRGMDFEFEVFDSKDESAENIASTLAKIKSKGYNYIVAPVTKNGAYWVAEYEKDSIVFIPTVNKSSSGIVSGNIIFGGIDYKNQIKKLLDYTNDKLAILSGSSSVARELTSDVMSLYYNPNIYLKSIANSKINPKYILKNNTNLQNASIFLNMPLVTSASIVSAFSSYNIKPYGLYSTQVNYSPLLFNMIQPKDRKNFYIANSIGYVNSKLNDISQNLGVKLKYNWVAYSSDIGVDKIYSRFYDSEPLFFEDLVNHEIKYKDRVVKIVGDEFKRAE